MTRILALCKFTHAPTNHWLTRFSNHLRLLRSMTYKGPNNSWDLLKLCTNGQRQLSIATGSSKGEIHNSWADTANSLISYVLTVTVCPFFSVVWHLLVNPLIQCNYNLITEGIWWLREEKKGVRAPFQCFLPAVYLCVTNLIFSNLPSSQAFFKPCSLFHRVCQIVPFHWFCAGERTGSLALSSRHSCIQTEARFWQELHSHDGSHFSKTHDG